ncbi:MAG: L-seryl-tRNA(Sec) selenium transferase [Polyangiaceae bacterium]|nr:L-seryl-tRNA(Sec) selenium transferase [Polyangiaceae bacterium]
MDRVAAAVQLEHARKRLGTSVITQLSRIAVEAARTKIGAGAPCPSFDEIVSDVYTRAAASLASRARPVINATGVILHTNLGRAALSASAVSALAESAARYTSLEMDLATGKRGARAAFAEQSLARITGAEAALVVNNNAAAVMLALSALAFGKKVLVSRGELVEIGGGFRVPDVLARSGAVMVEVGTTNKTRLDDFARALDEGGVAVVLSVHQGNFRQVGFVERPEGAALVRLAHERGALAVHDLGGGALVDLSAFGLRGEPRVQESVSAGFDLVCFSTDKALGGPQGGVLAGTTAAVEKARRDPLARALRMGRLPLVALEATVAGYLEGDLDAIPTLAAIRTPIERVRARAADWREALVIRVPAAAEVITVTDLDVAVGGGTLAEEPLPSAGLSIGVHNANVLADKLRTGDPPVFVRVQDDRVLVDARTVLPGEDEALLAALQTALEA